MRISLSAQKIGLISYRRSRY